VDHKLIERQVSLGRRKGRHLFGRVADVAFKKYFLFKNILKYFKKPIHI
jgi:hypothetical protein